CISDTLVPTTYLVDTTLSDASDYDQTVHAVRLHLKPIPIVILPKMPVNIPITITTIITKSALIR
ncbi:MAG: hypothetical protein E6Y78_27875, partial [Klebsiella oxytoca]|nr:hypothetical protein [Klebsiella oxytoca]